MPLAMIATLLIVLPVAALTESGLERRLKLPLGLAEERCRPDVRESPGWRAEEALPHKRDEPRAVTIGDDIFFAGGIAEIIDFGKPSEIPGVPERVEVRSLARFQRFDPETGRYAELPPMPQPLNHIGMVSYRGDVYVVGGHGRFLYGADPKRGFYRFSVRHRRWERLPSLPTPRGASAVEVIGDRLYVAGGLGARGSLSSRLEIFDFRTRRWSRGPDLPTAREHIAGAVAQGKFYVIGGRNPADDALRTVERYDPAQNSWEQVSPLPEGAGGLEAVAVDGRVIAMGGGDDRRRTVSGEVLRWAPEAGRWERLAPMRTPRHGFAAAVAARRVYTLGGSGCALFNATDTNDSFAPPSTR